MHIYIYEYVYAKIIHMIYLSQCFVFIGTVLLVGLFWVPLQNSTNIKLDLNCKKPLHVHSWGGRAPKKKQLFRRGKRYPKNQKFPFWMALTCWLSWRNNGLKCGYRGKLFSLEKSRNSNLNSIELLIFMKIKFIGLKCVWWLPRKMFTLNCFPHGLDSDHGGTEEPFVVARLRQLFHWPRTQHMSTFGFKVFYL